MRIVTAPRSSWLSVAKEEPARRRRLWRARLRWAWSPAEATWAEPRDAVAESSLTGRPEFATLEETWELIHEQWPDPEQIDDAALDLRRGEGDGRRYRRRRPQWVPRSRHRPWRWRRRSKAEYVGIGVEVDSRCGVPVVASTMSGSPAEAAGLQPGDVIAEVDDVSTRRMDIRESARSDSRQRGRRPDPDDRAPE